MKPTVSVPFRGISFLNPIFLQSKFTKAFPSPSGVSHFSIYKKKLKCELYNVSVPFRGISFLNSKQMFFDK